MLSEHVEVVKMAFNENLKRLRRDKGLNQGELADLCKVNASLIPKLEKPGSNPTLDTIYKLMRALNCSADTLLLDEESMGTSAVLAASFERANNLPEAEQRIVIDLIDKYCIANGMEKLFESTSKSFFGLTRVTSGIDKMSKKPE